MAAKQLAILSTAVAITLIQVGNLLAYARLDLIPLPEGFDFGFTPTAAVAMLAVLLPMAVLLSGLLLLVSAASRSYKEAQLYFFPLYLVGMLPAAAGALDIPLRSAIAIVPVAGVSVAVREVLSGQIDWFFVAIVGAVNTVAAVGVLRTAIGLLEDESVATARQAAPLASLDGPAAFRANVWKWFAVIWALFIGLGVAFPDLTVQVILTQFLLLAGSAVVAIRLYRLDPVKTLGVRLPRWTTWPIVVLLIVPLHALAGLVMQFANTVFPVPESYLQQMAQQFEPLEAMPWFAAVFLIAVAPGVCEEIAFRGLLYFGLERRYRGLHLALVVGLVFGFFHFDLSRIVMAGTLGVFLTVARILTGSILPGIVMHIGNNSLALALAEAEIPVDGLEPVLYLLAAAVTAGLFAVLWRENRNAAADPGRQPPQ
jgi:sodium transport system permease protein